MGAAIAIAVIVGIAVAYFAAKEFELIAKDKGYADKKYFWWTFLAGFVGIPMAIALPDRRGGALRLRGSRRCFYAGHSSQAEIQQGDEPDRRRGIHRRAGL